MHRTVSTVKLVISNAHLKTSTGSVQKVAAVLPTAECKIFIIKLYHTIAQITTTTALRFESTKFTKSTQRLYSNDLSYFCQFFCCNSCWLPTCYTFISKLINCGAFFCVTELLKTVSTSPLRTHCIKVVFVFEKNIRLYNFKLKVLRKGLQIMDPPRWIETDNDIGFNESDFNKCENNFVVNYR